MVRNNHRRPNRYYTKDFINVYKIDYNNKGYIHQLKEGVWLEIDFNRESSLKEYNARQLLKGLKSKIEIYAPLFLVIENELKREIFYQELLSN